MEPHAVSSLETWCSRCQNTETRGCDTINQLNKLGGGSNPQYAGITTTTGKHHVSPVVAGVIGAMVTLVVAGLLFGGLGFWVGKKKGSKSKRQQSDTGSDGGNQGGRKVSFAFKTLEKLKRSGTLINDSCLE